MAKKDNQDKPGNNPRIKRINIKKTNQFIFTLNSDPNFYFFNHDVYVR